MASRPDRPKVVIHYSSSGAEHVDIPLFRGGLPRGRLRLCAGGRGMTAWRRRLGRGLVVLAGLAVGVALLAFFVANRQVPERSDTPSPPAAVAVIEARPLAFRLEARGHGVARRSEEHTSELQSRPQLVCRLLLEKKKCTRLTSAHVSTKAP